MCKKFCKKIFFNVSLDLVNLHQAGLAQTTIDNYFLTDTPPHNLQHIQLTEELLIELHTYIISKYKHHSKSDIGKFYQLLNPSYSTLRPDNIFRKIEKNV